MTNLTISIDEQKLEQLRQTAQHLGVDVDELVRRSIDYYVVRRKRFEEAADYVLNKNEELYRRLAK